MRWAHIGRSSLIRSSKTAIADPRSTFSLRSLIRNFSKSPNVPSRIIFSGIQPTGVPHLGNYLGALQQWVQLQNKAPPTTQLLFSVVDLHAITVNQDANQLRRWKRQTLATLLAAGLNPERSIIFYQSSVPAHTELMWILGCTASMGYLSRMTQWKVRGGINDPLSMIFRAENWKTKLSLPDKTSIFEQGAKSKLKLGLFSYPVLQAADILLYGTTHVPVGQDQVQHIEFARECAGNFNGAHGDVLEKPKTILSPAKRIMSLKEPLLKMSKSHEDARSRILITDTLEVIKMKIRLALTDSIEGISYDELKRPGVSNLLSITTHLDRQGRSIEELAQECKSLNIREFKDIVTNAISTGMKEIREKYNYFMEVDGGRYVDDIAIEGSRKAREMAEITMTKVRHVVGFE